MRNTIVALSLVAVIIGFAGGFTVARLRYKPLLNANSEAIIAKDAQIKDLKEMVSQESQKVAEVAGTTFEMINNQMVVETAGSTSAVTKDVLLPDGTTVMSNGTVMKKDGSKIKLTEGEAFKIR